MERNSRATGAFLLALLLKSVSSPLIFSVDQLHRSSDRQAEQEKRSDVQSLKTLPEAFFIFEITFSNTNRIYSKGASCPEFHPHSRRSSLAVVMRDEVGWRLVEEDCSLEISLNRKSSLCTNASSGEPAFL
jgi:hypothetical protein